MAKSSAFKYAPPHADLGHRRAGEVQELGRGLLSRRRLLRPGLRHHRQKGIKPVPQSFDHIESWITDFLKHGSVREPEKFTFVLIANKVDLEAHREVEETAVS
jgi:hypothetical protein